MLTLGHDYDYVRNQMDLPRINALSAYRAKNPPEAVSMHRICLMLEAFFGIERNDESTIEDDSDADDMLEALRNFPQG